MQPIPNYIVKFCWIEGTSVSTVEGLPIENEFNRILASEIAEKLSYMPKEIRERNCKCFEK